MSVFVALSAASTLLEELEIEFDEALRMARAASTLDDEIERLSDEV